MGVNVRGLHQLQLYCVDSKLMSQITVDSARHQAGIRKDAAVLRLASGVPSLEVAFHVVAGGVGFEERDTAEQTGDVADSTLQRGVSDVLEHVGTDDQVESTPERHGGQLLERGEPDVPPFAVLRHHVFAGVHADVANLGAKAPQLGAPASLARTDVEHGAQLAAEEVFGDTGDHANLAANGLGGVDAGTRLAVPLREVGFVIRLAAGGRRRWGRSHA